jgi:hypothetical protein
MENSRIHALVASMDRQIAALTSFPTSDEGRRSLVGVREGWKAVVEALALSPEPTRVCPKCGNLGMDDATLCGYCWTHLGPAEKPDIAEAP